jgi:hypothetical protein
MPYNTRANLQDRLPLGNKAKSESNLSRTTNWPLLLRLALDSEDKLDLLSKLRKKSRFDCLRRPFSELSLSRLTPTPLSLRSICSLCLRGLLRKEKDGMMRSKHQQMTKRKIVQVIRSDAIGHEVKGNWKKQ